MRQRPPSTRRRPGLPVCVPESCVLSRLPETHLHVLPSPRAPPHAVIRGHPQTGPSRRRWHSALPPCSTASSNVPPNTEPGPRMEGSPSQLPSSPAELALDPDIDALAIHTPSLASALPSLWLWTATSAASPVELSHPGMAQEHKICLAHLDSVRSTVKGVRRPTLGQIDPGPTKIGTSVTVALGRAKPPLTCANLSRGDPTPVGLAGFEPATP